MLYILGTNIANKGNIQIDSVAIIYDIKQSKQCKKLLIVYEILKIFYQENKVTCANA